MIIIRVLAAISLLAGLFAILSIFKFSPYLIVATILIGNPAYKLYKKIVFICARLIDSSINDTL